MIAETSPLPPGWARATVGDIGQFINGLAFKPADWGASGRPIIRIQNLTGQSQRLNYTTRVVPESVVVRPGDILVSWSATLDAFCWAGPEAVLNQHIFRVVPSAEFPDRRFVLWSLRQAITEIRGSPHTHGSTMRHVNRGPFLAHPLNLPPAREQDRISDALESVTTRLDAAVATLKRVKAKLAQYRASVLKAAVEGRLVPTEAERARQDGRSYEPASVLRERILAERRRRWTEGATQAGRANTARGYAEPAEPKGDDLPEVPAGWCWTTMEALSIEGPQNGLYVPKSKYGSGVPILRIEDFQTDWCRSAHDLRRVAIDSGTAADFGLREGDILVNRVNSPSHLGKAMAVTSEHGGAVFESNMMRVRLAAQVLPRFAAIYLNSSVGKSRLTANAKWAVNQASINQGDVGATPVPLPPAAEQARVVQKADRLMSTSAWMERVVRDAAEHCRHLHQSILRWAFQGRLVDQDPSDESASALLEQIRASHAAAGTPKPRRTTRTRAEAKRR